MPVRKCSNGKYRIGSGKCMYTTKKAADKAYKAYRAKKNFLDNQEKQIVD